MFQSVTGLAQTRYTGSIEGADFIIDVPTEPSGDVLFIARGFRPAFFPLSPVYEVDTDFYQTLLKEGWMIASTGFRTNDWIIEEGARDILALQAYLAKKFGPIKRSILYGETMGGGIGVWLAENHPGQFAGVFALGAQLFPYNSEGRSSESVLAQPFSAAPRIPIIFVANLEEAESSRTYLAQAKQTAGVALWTIRRPGHVNVNSAERLAAMRALVEALNNGPLSSKPDATLELRPHSTAAFHGPAAAGVVRQIRPLYGNIYTNFVEDDLKKLGIEIGTRFSFSKGLQTHAITFAKAYSDVPLQAWVAFIDSEGYVQLSRNYANAAETLNAQPGDPLIIAGK